MRQSPQGPGFGHGCRANLRPPCVGAGEAESRQTRPHTFLRGPNYSSSCGGNSVLIHCEKWAALGIPQHHPTAAKARNPEARSAPGGRPHQPGLASPHPRHGSCVSRSGGWCIKGAHGDFWRASQTGAAQGSGCLPSWKPSGASWLTGSVSLTVAPQVPTPSAEGPRERAKNPGSTPALPL